MVGDREQRLVAGRKQRAARDARAQAFQCVDEPGFVLDRVRDPRRAGHESRRLGHVVVAVAGQHDRNAG